MASALEQLNAFSYIEGGYDGAMYGGGESGWGMTALWVILAIIIILVIWRVSDFRKDRLCISTDLREYWPAGTFGLPALPGNDYLPAVSQYLPARESLDVPALNRTRNDAFFQKAMLGYNV